MNDKCNICGELKFKQYTIPHTHSVSCDKCGKVENGVAIGTYHYYLSSKIVSLPQGWFTLEDRQLGDMYHYCSTQCIEAHMKEWCHD